MSILQTSSSSASSSSASSFSLEMLVHDLLHPKPQTPYGLDPELFTGPDGLKLEITPSIVVPNALVALVFLASLCFAFMQITTSGFSVFLTAVFGVPTYRQFKQNCLNDAFHRAIAKRDAATVTNED